MRFSDNLTNITSALCKVQAEIKNPIKNQVNKGVQGAPKYANLEDTLQEYVRPILTKHGMSVYQSVKTCDEGKSVGVCTVLFHNSGEFIESDYVYCDIKIPLSKEGKEILTQSQATGVCITYLRRYSLNASLGINGDKDTDGSYEEITQNDYKTEGATRPSSPSVTSNKNTFTSPAPDNTSADSVITFGKHNGKTIREVFKQDRQYAEWLLNNERTEEGIKSVIASLLEQAAAESEHLKQQVNEIIQQELPDLFEQPVDNKDGLPF